MDLKTITAYEQSAAARCVQYRLILATELLQFARGFFHPGALTADIGCGSGRDVAWLVNQGFPTVGYDASAAMLAEAQKAYPTIDVRNDSLPALATIEDATYSNILCLATLMHLPASTIPAAISSIARVLQPGGRLLLSVRSSRTATIREADGRLYTLLTAEMLQEYLGSAGLGVSHVRNEADHYRSGVSWLTVLAEKPALAG